MVGQTALHDVGAEVGAGSGGGHSAAVGAVGHPHDGPHALPAQLRLGGKMNPHIHTRVS